ncbi:hypothetical protein EsDP_00001675 [Epichloe bromicola]|uniref:Uncharacterized protein n=1 Tax=Epichloe bromicola TaxID=79588 RepID=A0ABQ0CII9_9HYPO
MDGEFVSVKTWQGFIMVSTSLLPQSFDEKTRIYPENHHCSLDSTLRVGTAPPLLQHGNSHLATTRRRPPIPDYWHHEFRNGDMTATGFDSDANLFHTSSSSSSSSNSNSAVSSAYSAQSYSPVYTPRTDDDAASIPDTFSSLFSPWESSAAGVGRKFSVDWEDPAVNADASFFPLDSYAHPAAGLLSQPGFDLMDEANPEPCRYEAHFTMPTHFSELQGSIKRRRVDAGLLL